MKTALLLLLLPAGLAAQTPLPARSPFLPPDTRGAGPEGPSEMYELAGASVTNDGAQICLYDRTHRQTRWLPVGRTSGGIEVLSYDQGRDQAVVKFDGGTHVLSLRKASTSASMPIAAVFTPMQPGPATPAAKPIVDPSTLGKSPEVIKQEREARMLVSDLLEIGMEQRKAYEKAHQQAQHHGGS